MSKLVKIFALAALIAGAVAVAPNRAEAYWRHGWYGGWGWGPSITFWGGYPYYPYYAQPYYVRPYYLASPACGRVPVKVWRHGHWVLRSVPRCW